MKINRAKLSLLIIFIIFLCSCYKPVFSPGVIKGPGDTEGSVKAVSGFEGPTIRILSWNINKEGNEKKWINDILNIDCTHDPDIILFQEAKMNAELKYVLQVKNLDWKFVPNAKKNNEYTGVLTASQSLSIDDTLLISVGREPLAKIPKTILVTSYLVHKSGKDIPLLVANVHGLTFASVENFYSQIEELYRLILPYMEESAIIVAGDFNAWSAARASFINEYLSRLDLKEVSSLQNATTPSWFIRLITPAEKLPLDRVFYSYKKLSIDESKSRVLDWITSSDHKPLYIEFRIL